MLYLSVTLNDRVGFIDWETEVCCGQETGPGDQARMKESWDLNPGSVNAEPMLSGKARLSQVDSPAGSSMESKPPGTPFYAILCCHLINSTGQGSF